MTKVSGRLHYYRRLVPAYILGSQSQLSFWHDVPTISETIERDAVGPYYMDFSRKADYSGVHDANGIPMLDYHGRVGLQYNPIAIAQWGLGNLELYRQRGERSRLARGLVAGEWLLENLALNRQGLAVWNHNFDWEYRETLRAPWYSALSQGQGISLLVRLHAETGDDRFLSAASAAFRSFLTPTEQGGVSCEENGIWFEETVVYPPTHILNGFLWASWGVLDFSHHTQSVEARGLFDDAVATLRRHLERFDTGYWSLYELAGQRLPMLASPFYHRLHIVQLEVMARLTGDSFFRRVSQRWHSYSLSRAKSLRAKVGKAVFKLLYY